MDSMFVLAGLLIAGGALALLALGPLGLMIGAALVAAGVALGGYRVFRMVTRRTSSDRGVHRQS